MAQRMALYMQDKHPIHYEIEMAKYAEEKGFCGNLAGRHPAGPRLRRDDERLSWPKPNELKIGSGVLPIWTRNPAVIAATWSTMWELAGKAARWPRPGYAWPGRVVGTHCLPGGRRPPQTAHSHARTHRGVAPVVYHGRGHLSGRVRQPGPGQAGCSLW
jgi:hypothetical protein